MWYERKPLPHDADGVVAYNVDDLKAVVARNTAKRRKEMLEAEVVLREEHEGFNAWHAALGAVPANFWGAVECAFLNTNKLSAASTKESISNVREPLKSLA